MDLNTNAFNAAYSSLENTIRNFSREKMQYEQKIDALSHQIEITKDNLQKVNSEQQEQLVDYHKLVDLLEENEHSRINLEALIDNVERKQEIISETVEGFERIDRDIGNRFEALEEFSYCVKYRQVQLLQWIDETTKKNVELKTSLKDLQQKVDQLTKDINEATALAQNVSLEHSQEKAGLLSHLQAVKVAAGNEIQVLTEAKDSVEKQLNEAKKSKEELEIKSIEEKASLSGELDSLKNQYDQAMKTIEEQLIQHEAEKSALNQQLLQTTTNLQQTISELQMDKSLLFEELENVHKQQEEQKEEMNRQRQEFESESTAAKQHLEEITTSHEQGMTQVRNEKLALATELETATKGLEAAKINIKDQHLHYEKEKESREKCLQEMQLKLEEQTREFASEKELLSKELEDVKVGLNELSEKSAQEKTSMMQELELVKLEYKENEANNLAEKQALHQIMDEMVSKHETEKSEMTNKHNVELKKMTEEFHSCRNDLRALYQKYQEQKKAIGKLIEDTGIRPISLPNSKDTNQSKKSPSLSLNRKTQGGTATPTLTTLVPPPVPVPRPSILKRPYQESDKTKNVSFGPTLISDFDINSSPDTDTNSPEDSNRKVTKVNAFMRWNPHNYLL